MNICSFQAHDAPVIGYIQDDHDRLVAHKKRPAIIICAGGAYRWLSPREKDPVALSFAAMGYHTFLIEYSVGDKAAGLKPLRELAEAVRILRKRAGEWHIEPNRIAVLGFSAGGHLAATLGVHWRTLGLERPDALILCYPVITAEERLCNAQSLQSIAGEDMRDFFSLEKHVSPDTPPTFLWHTANDEVVPVANALAFAGALAENGVPFGLHVFPVGRHGLGLAFGTSAEGWAELMQKWLLRLGFGRE